MSDFTTWANQPTGTVTSGGTTASDTSFTVTTVNNFPIASNAANPVTIFHIIDPALPTEIMRVTASSNGSGQAWTVARAQEGTSGVSHASNWTCVQIVSAGDLTSFKQATGALVAGATVTSSVTETVVCTYQPPTGELLAGTTYELIANGVMRASAGAVNLLLWRLRWGWVSASAPGICLLSMNTGSSAGTTNSGATTTATSATNVGNMVCAGFSSAMSVTTGIPFDLNGTVSFIDTTHAVANMNFSFQQSTGVCGTGVASNGTSVTVSGSGPLVLTATWASNTSVIGLTAPAPLAYRAA